MAADVTSGAAYYRDAGVRARMLEACGAVGTAPPTATYVAGLLEGSAAHPNWAEADRLPIERIDELWAGGADISRSLWDTGHLVFMLELDYLNVDQPAEPFLRPAEVFFKIEGAFRAALQALRGLGLAPRVLMTGRGYQFAGAVRLDAPVVDQLAELSPLPAWYAGVEQRRRPGITAALTARQARASEGLGKVIEFVAHRILAGASRAASIPVVFNGTVVGDGIVGRECISIDFSHVGDPLDVRHMRLPFSLYQLHRLRPDLFGSQVAALPPLVALPRRREPLFTRLSAGRSLSAGQAAAADADAGLPDLASGIETALERYRASALAAFHRRFEQDRRLAATPPHTALAGLPPCVTAALTWPNDRLLKPEHIQHLVRVLMARGTRPAAIAGLVQAAYESDHDWGDRWSRMEPRARADFDVRVFAGLISTGLDSLVDFNCVSTQEKAICPRIACRFDLRADRERLLRARSV
ncbi:MAG TPA: hypothetical protein VFO19_02005 [Vicinamibacterales bacterium]|nr:hypothetical protein [Vicinamibacterales bacterium]